MHPAVQLKSPGLPEQGRLHTEPRHPLLPSRLSYPALELALSFHFKDFAYHISLVLLMALAFYQGQSASNIWESNYLETFR